LENAFARSRDARWPSVNLPNTLTLVRIFLVPFLVVFLIASAEPRNYPAGAIFLAAVLTDWLDGRIARSRRQVTTLGQLLDPIADKLLIAAALISLVEIGRVPAWVATVIIGRDIAITGLRGIAASQGLIIAASQLGKIKMVTEVVAVSLLILDLGTSRVPGLPLSLGGIALGVAVAMSVVSGIDYFARFWRQLGLGGTIRPKGD
ncbi:MAG: CDP-diacylglycerol--glycerol-3-phosphate 3-phosphatidyltransferase, partial [candidate division NC10 bacterium]